MNGFSLARRVLLLLLLPAAVLATGCVSTHPPKSSAAARAAAIGTWEYDVTGFGPLEEGVFRILTRDGQLHAIVRDLRQGRLRAQVDLRGSRMELTVGHYRISGRIEEGQFNGFLRPRRWDVSMSPRRRRPRRLEQTASLYAERVRSRSRADESSLLNCASILREANGCN